MIIYEVTFHSEDNEESRWFFSTHEKAEEYIEKRVQEVMAPSDAYLNPITDVPEEIERMSLMFEINPREVDAKF